MVVLCLLALSLVAQVEDDVVEETKMSGKREYIVLICAFVYNNKVYLHFNNKIIIVY